MVSLLIRIMDTIGYDTKRENSHLVSNDLHEIFELCGGIPRSIFKHTLSEMREVIERSINKMDIKILRYVGTLDEGNDFSHNLVHIHTNDTQMNIMIDRYPVTKAPYTFCELKFASTKVGDKVFAKLK